MRTYTALEVVELFDEAQNAISKLRDDTFEEGQRHRSEGRYVAATQVHFELPGFDKSIIELQRFKMNFFNESRSS